LSVGRLDTGDTGTNGESGLFPVDGSTDVEGHAPLPPQEIGDIVGGMVTNRDIARAGEIFPTVSVLVTDRI
jgi:hypothetical protein